MRKVFAVAAAAAIGITTASSMASSITLNQVGQNGLFFGNSSLTANTTLSGTIYVGAFTWQDSGGNDYLTFCTELAQQTNNPTTFDFNDVADAPVPGGGMGEYRAGLIQSLYDNHYGSAFSSRTESAAFQLAIWEIVHETGVEEGGSYDLNVAVGDFRVTGGNVQNEQDGFGQSAVSLANTWLSGLSSVDVTTLVALTNEQYQDQILLIPLPAPVLMAGIGLLAVPLVRRKLMRS